MVVVKFRDIHQLSGRHVAWTAAAFDVNAELPTSHAVLHASAPLVDGGAGDSG
jgi:hypothetical protein